MKYKIGDSVNTDNIDGIIEDYDEFFFYIKDSNSVIHKISLCDNEYIIPKYNIETLEKKLARYEKKGAKFQYKILGDTVEEDDKGRKHACYRVEIEGGYKIDGWKFIAIIEHPKVDSDILDKNPENIIRVMPDVNAGEIPSRFRTCGPYCEHCKKERLRNDTYIVQNEKTGEYKQVGRNCLMDFTGFDAKIAAEYASALKSLDSDLSSLMDFDDDDVMGSYFREKYTAVEGADKVRCVIYSYIKEHGYQKENAPKIVSDIENTLIEKDDIKNIVEKTKADVDKMNAWIKNDYTPKSDFDKNCYNAWVKSLISQRDYKLCCCMVVIYLREMQRSKENENKTWAAGNIGDKITIKVANVKVLWANEYGGSRWSSGTVSYKYRIVGEDGNVYIYSTSKDINEGDTITAVIKNQTEFRGEKQTELSTNMKGIVKNDTLKVGSIWVDKKTEGYSGTIYYEIKELLDSDIICDIYKIGHLNKYVLYKENSKMSLSEFRKLKLKEIKDRESIYYFIGGALLYDWDKYNTIYDMCKNEIIKKYEKLGFNFIENNYDGDYFLNEKTGEEINFPYVEFNNIVDKRM